MTFCIKRGFIAACLFVASIGVSTFGFADNVAAVATLMYPFGLVMGTTGIAAAICVVMWMIGLAFD